MWHNQTLTAHLITLASICTNAFMAVTRKMGPSLICLPAVLGATTRLHSRSMNLTDPDMLTCAPPPNCILLFRYQIRGLYDGLNLCDRDYLE